MTPIEKYFPEKVAKAFKAKLGLTSMEQLHVLSIYPEQLDGMSHLVGMTRYMLDKTIEKAKHDLINPPKRSYKKKVK